jgi:transposase
LKREIVAALSEPGASASIVARRYDVNANQLFKWRRQFGGTLGGASIEPLRLLPVEITPAPAAEARSEGPTAHAAVPAGSIEIALRGGTRVRIRGAVDPAAVAAAVAAVMAPRRRR